MIPNPTFPDLRRYRTEDRPTRELRAYLRWEWNGSAGTVASLATGARRRHADTPRRPWTARLLGLFHGSPRAPSTATPAPDRRTTAAMTRLRAFRGLGRPSPPPSPVASAAILSPDLDPVGPEVHGLRQSR